MHSTPVSAHHSLCSHPLAVILAAKHWLVSPSPDPATVTLIDPVAPRALPWRPPLTTPTANETALLMLPTFSPAVTTTRLLRNIPFDNRATNDVPDRHSVASLMLCPCLLVADNAARPMPTPIRVTCIEPLVAAFANLERTEACAPWDTAWDTLPM